MYSKRKNIHSYFWVRELYEGGTTYEKITIRQRWRYTCNIKKNEN